MKTEKPRILIVDDEEVIRELLVRALENEGYEIETVGQGETACEKIKKGEFNLLITDLRMPGVTGSQLLETLKRNNPFVEAIVVTGYPTVESAVEALKMGAYDFVCKPFDIHHLAVKIRDCLEKQRLNSSFVRLSELDHLLELSRAPVDCNDEFLDRVLSAAMESCGGMTAGLFLERGEKFSLARFRGAIVADCPAITGCEGAATRLLGQNTSFFINRDDVDEKRLTAPEFRVLAALFPPSMAALPLKSDHGVHGMLVVGAGRGGGFTCREKNLLNLVSCQAAVALDNARLYRRLSGQLRQMEETVRKLNLTQDQLIQSGKMAQIGQLATGIAHEIRNPLGIILAGIECVSVMSTDDPGYKPAIGKIRGSVERANRIIVDLLRFSRSEKMEFSRVDLRMAADDAFALVGERVKSRGIKVVREFEEGELPVKGDHALLRQVFFNLLSNAIDASMPGGTVALRIGCAREDGTGTVRAEVADNGGGISAEDLGRIFDPFFTTKEPGKGTGMGLSITHMIIERHGGTINVDSEPGKGTRFRIDLPLAAGVPAVVRQQ